MGGSEQSRKIIQTEDASARKVRFSVGMRDQIVILDLKFMNLGATKHRYLDRRAVPTLVSC